MPQTLPKIAIFGGTFDPIHWGHLLIAETAVDQFQLDRVLWVPTFRPSYKAHPLLAFEQRLEMVRRAIAHHPAFTVSAIEVAALDGQPAGASYAIDTFNALQSLEPNALWYWIVGHDAFQSLPKWRGSQSLITQCIWLVAPRAEDEGGKGWEEPSAISHRLMDLPALRWHLLDMPSIGISSSLIRQRCQDGRSIRDWVPETVHSYIAEQNLYQMS